MRYIYEWKMKYSITAIILSVCLTACGSSSSNTDEDTDSLDGTWVASCFEVDSNFYQTKVYTFSGESWSGTGTTYSDMDCTQIVIPTSSAGGYFSLGEPVITESGVTALELNISIQILDGIDYGSVGAVNRFDLIKNEGNRLFFSEYSSPTERPTSLNFDTVYYKR